jgi:Zn-dependent peptidase ImmA (M78 family)/transcriptional regulator with XRE-family HTH domain
LTHPREDIARKISEARRKLGLTQADLASAAGLPSLQTVSDIERGKRDIHAWELAKTAQVLHLNVAELLAVPSAEVPRVLWRKRPENAALIEADFLEKCQQYRLLEVLTDQTRGRAFPQVDVKANDLGYADVARFAVSAVHEFDLGSRPAAALERVLEEDYGVKIWYFKLGEGGSAACTLGDFGPAILMNSEEVLWRRNFNFAHEVFHLATWESFPPSVLDADQELWKRVESFANSFASTLLLPADPFSAEFEKRLVGRKVRIADLVELARQFEVSTEALLWRCVSLNRLKRAQVEDLLGSSRFRSLVRETMPGRWHEPPEIPERFVRMASLAYQRGNMSRARLAQLLGTSLIDLGETLAQYGLGEQNADTIELPASS